MIHFQGAAPLNQSMEYYLVFGMEALFGFRGGTTFPGTICKGNININLIKSKDSGRSPLKAEQKHNKKEMNIFKMK